jgi:hypothetical protein
MAIITTWAEISLNSSHSMDGNQNSSHLKSERFVIYSSLFTFSVWFIVVYNTFYHLMAPGQLMVLLTIFMLPILWISIYFIEKRDFIKINMKKAVLLTLLFIIVLNFFIITFAFLENWLNDYNWQYFFLEKLSFYYGIFSLIFIFRIAIIKLFSKIYLQYSNLTSTLDLKGKINAVKNPKYNSSKVLPTTNNSMENSTMKCPNCEFNFIKYGDEEQKNAPIEFCPACGIKVTLLIEKDQETQDLLEKHQEMIKLLKSKQHSISGD